MEQTEEKNYSITWPKIEGEVGCYRLGKSGVSQTQVSLIRVNGQAWVGAEAHKEDQSYHIQSH